MADVNDEIARLSGSTAGTRADHPGTLNDLMSEEEIAKLDLFDQLQLTNVVQVCRESKSLSDAGRRLFAVSRTTRTSTNDADRLRKYLSRFGLSWQDVEHS